MQTSRFPYTSLNWHKPTLLLKEVATSPLIFSYPGRTIQPTKTQALNGLVLISSLNLLGVWLHNACVGLWKEVPWGQRRMRLTL